MKRRTKNLLHRCYLSSLIISTGTIILVQSLSFVIILSIMIKDADRNAETLANEMTTILQEPLYQIDDGQVIRIAESLLSSVRIDGMSIESSVSGVLLDRWKKKSSYWLESKNRTISYKGIELGKFTFLYSDSQFLALVENLFITTFILLLALLLANYIGNHYIVQKKINSTFTYLMSGINSIADGRDNFSIDNSGYEDVDMIICAMNEMSKKIVMKQKELEKINDELEQRVALRTNELENTVNELQIMQERLLESGKLAALGTLSAGIAHEFNTPLGAIVSSNNYLIDYFDSKLIKNFSFISAISEDDYIHYRNMVEIGINYNSTLNIPMTTRKEVKVFAEYLEKNEIPNSYNIAELILDMGLKEKVNAIFPILKSDKNFEILTFAYHSVIARRMTEIIAEAGKKATGVISVLKSYLSSDSQDKKQYINIDDDIKKVLTLMHNLLIKGITVETEFNDVYVYGYSDKLSQIWINLIRNAAQAMDYKGRLKIVTKQISNKAIIKICDSGKGIPEEIIDTIFDPFFTTRSHGDGMGLGLDICKKIVQLHNGEITVESRPGKTEFTVSLPIE